MIANICDRFGLDPATSVVGHFFLDPQRKTDPVTGLAHSRRTYDQLLQDIVAEYYACISPAGGTTTPVQPQLNFIANAGTVITTAKLNIRNDLPKRTADVVQEVPKDTRLTYVGWVTNGEAVNGNTKWFQDANGDYFWSGATR